MASYARHYIEATQRGYVVGLTLGGDRHVDLAHYHPADWSEAGVEAAYGRARDAAGVLQSALVQLRLVGETA